MQAIERIRTALEALKPDLRQTWVKLDKLPYIHATDDPTAKPYSTPVVGRFDYMESADYILSCNPAAMTAVLTHIDALEAENAHLKSLADSEGSRAVEYLRRARKAEAENERLRAESEDRLQNCAALVAEVERLRKDADRYRFLRAQRIGGEPGVPVIAVPNGMRSGYYMNEENADYAVDTAMKGTP